MQICIIASYYDPASDNILAWIYLSSVLLFSCDKYSYLIWFGFNYSIYLDIDGTILIRELFMS